MTTGDYDFAETTKELTGIEIDCVPQLKSASNYKAKRKHILTKAQLEARIANLIKAREKRKLMGYGNTRPSGERLYRSINGAPKEYIGRRSKEGLHPSDFEDIRHRHVIYGHPLDLIAWGYGVTEDELKEFIKKCQSEIS